MTISETIKTQVRCGKPERVGWWGGVHVPKTSYFKKFKHPMDKAKVILFMVNQIYN